MAKTKQQLWTKFGGKEFYAKMAENATNDGNGKEISQTYATKDVATTSADGLMSAADKTKMDNITNVSQVSTRSVLEAYPDPNDNSVILYRWVPIGTVIVS